MTDKRITAALLEANGACRDQVQLFRELFPEGAPLTVKAALSVADKFDWNWAARHLLSATALKAYDEATATAWKAYTEARATARKARDEATAPARKAYREATATAWEAYGEATAAASKAYGEATATAWKAYTEARATAFALAYLADNA